MNKMAFGPAQPVLRCGRCGRFVEWPESQLLVVCSCRPHLELLPVLVREATAQDHDRAQAILRRHFGHTAVVAFGQAVEIESASTLVAEAENDIGGVLAWRLLDDALHVIAVATEPMWQRSGIGGHLLAEAELLARRQGRPRVVVTIGNDNVPALYFYQRRGYRISGVAPIDGGGHPAGFGGIPIVDELRLSKSLRPSS
jgi:ribosomal protein S18 acetylase RimI-like enzyme